jgi:glycosyltransferase involved in cell wall biosynthesis
MACSHKNRRPIPGRYYVMVLAPAPIVSVIMSMRDSAATVNAAIRSIIWQTLTDWELILIDDGSRDDSAARAAAFGDPRIRIIRHEESRGPACRRNEAVRLARGEFIAVMDADDICYPERLAVQVSVLRSNPGIDVLATKAVLFRRRGEVLGVMRTPATHEEIVAYPYRGFPFMHPTWCGKATWFRNHQYDENLQVAEDQELLLRTVATSRFAAVDKILLGYRKERIGLAKSFYGRVLYSRVIWRHARQSGTYGPAVTDIALHFSKSAAELVATGFGAEEWLLKQKLNSSWTPEETAQWNMVWSNISNANENPRPVVI